MEPTATCAFEIGVDLQKEKKKIGTKHFRFATMFKKPLAEFKTSGMIQNRRSSPSFLTRF